MNDITSTQPLTVPPPVPPGPTDDQLYNLADEFHGDPVPAMRRALELWGGQPPQPIPLSERAPGPKDCDAEGRCWLGAPADIHDSASWRLARPSERFSDDIAWLPAHAMPMPEGQANG